MVKEITYKPYGKKAILIECIPVINDEILNKIIGFKHKIELHKKNIITDLIIGYNSLTIKYSIEVEDYSKEVKNLDVLYASINKIVSQSNYLWKIPVCYDDEFGIDLIEVSKVSGLPKEEVINLHSKEIYTVFFIGFLPGFLYLGGLNEQLFVNRKANPRLQIEKGSVAIGGKQTGIYPLNSPGGWNVIGKSPIDFFNSKDELPCFAKAGDKIEFTPISKTEFYFIENEILKANYKISKTLLND